VAVKEFDLLESVEHVLRVEPVARRGPLFLDDEPHHRVVVDGLPREAAVLHDLPDLIELLRGHGMDPPSGNGWSPIVSIISNLN
jgi:hypothetical protein